MKNITIFVSGSGTNCEQIIRHFSGSSEVRVGLVVSSRADAYALERAHRLGVDTRILTKAAMADEAQVLTLLDAYHTDLIVLAGYMLMVPDYLVHRYQRRMVNIHPSLLPRHGGKGMYGHHVHEAVKAAGETETGITIHYVSDECDGGEIIAQFSTPVAPEDTAEAIEAKVHVLEHKHFPEVIAKVVEELD